MEATLTFDVRDDAEARTRAEMLGAKVIRVARPASGRCRHVEVRLDQRAKDRVALAVYQRQCRFAQIIVLKQRAS